MKMFSSQELTETVWWWILALRRGSAGSAGSAGLTDGIPVPGSSIFSDKWAILAEFSVSIGVIGQTISADSVLNRVVCGTQDRFLQSFFVAATVIGNKRRRVGVSVALKKPEHLKSSIWQKK